MEIRPHNKSGLEIKIKTANLVIDGDGKIVVNNGEAMVISGPGEYEVKGFSVIGYKTGAYLIEAEDIRLGYLTEKQDVEILITADWEKAKEIQPNIVLPAKGGEAALIKDSGLEARTEKKLVVNKLNLPEETELVILKD